MLGRSIERDFDIAYHRRGIERALEAIASHAQLLVEVGYDPYKELDDAEDQCAILKEQLSPI